MSCVNECKGPEHVKAKIRQQLRNMKYDKNDQDDDSAKSTETADSIRSTEAVHPLESTETDTTAAQSCRSLFAKYIWSK